MASTFFYHWVSIVLTERHTPALILRILAINFPSICWFPGALEEGKDKIRRGSMNNFEWDGGDQYVAYQVSV